MIISVRYRWTILFFFLTCAMACQAIGVRTDTLDTLAEKPRRESWIKRTLRKFTETDTNYIELQRYNFTVMAQNTNTVERYTFMNSNGLRVTFSPRGAMKVGPYFGYRWAFLGYTFDLNHLSNSNRKKELDLSIYSAQVGIDLFYRTLGDDYRVKAFSVGGNLNLNSMKNVSFNGLDGKISGFNLYYIFNHHKFSYPAAFSQSTVQRRSAGSVLAGIGYMRHSISVDWKKFQELAQDVTGYSPVKLGLDTTLRVSRIHYTDISLSGGYGYNWVFARNFLFAVSLSGALGYKHTSSETDHDRFSLRSFKFSNLAVDGIGRFGLVYNNMRWYAGTSAVFHTYYYKKSKFSTNTTFGNINFYIGFNFGRRKK